MKRGHASDFEVQNYTELNFTRLGTYTKNIKIHNNLWSIMCVRNLMELVNYNLTLVKQGVIL